MLLIPAELSATFPTGLWRAQRPLQATSRRIPPSGVKKPGKAASAADLVFFSSAVTYTLFQNNHTGKRSGRAVDNYWEAGL